MTKVRRKPGARSVVVVGAGPAGLRQAVELAEAGDQVYLVEGGTSLLPAREDSGFMKRLAQLGDRVRLITRADLVRVEESGGQYKIRLKRRASRVLEERCNSCDACARICPATLTDMEKRGLALRTAIDSATPGNGGYNILKEGPPCQDACPVRLDVRGYVGLIADGKPKESLALIRERLLFPGVIGRICTRPCEKACNRGFADEPVAICWLKRYAADWELEHSGGFGGSMAPAEKPAPTGKKVAIVGSGPAGLACAAALAGLGHAVTVFEALPVSGGMLTVGIPEYRLPRRIVEGEVGLVEALGVKIVTGKALGKDMDLDELLAGHDAVFLAIGAHRSRKLGIPGEDGKGVIHGVDFLKEIALGKRPGVGKKVVVIGGGDVAIDSARSALRLGAKKVSIIYRRTRSEMPAHEGEAKAAEDEGVEMTYLAAPVEVIIRGGRVSGLRCVRMELGEPDETGRRTPAPVPDSEYVIECDTVVPAVGQGIDSAGLPAGDRLVGRDGRLRVVDPETLATAKKGVFAGGDAVTGPGSAIEAIASGRKAALSIHRRLTE